MDITYSISGFAVGLIVGLTGVGGGSLMTPLLTLIFGISPAVAVGTDLLYAGVTKAGGTLAHSLRGTVDWTITRRLATGSIPAAAITIALLHHFFPQGIGEASKLITFALGIALLATAMTILFRQQLLRFAQRHEHQGHVPVAATITTGAVLGVLVSLSSVGAGALGAAALLMLYPRLPLVRIVGTDIAHAVPLTLVAGAGHWWLGSVDFQLLIALLIGSLPGIWLGSRLSGFVPERILRPLLATLLIIIGSRFVFQ